MKRRKAQRVNAIVILVGIVSQMSIFNVFDKLFGEPFSFLVPTVILLPSVVYLILEVTKSGKQNESNE